MFARALTALSLVFFAACSSSDGPILVGQGTGESEYSLAFARLNLAELLRSCVGVCPLDDGQRAFLDRLIQMAPFAPEAFYEISGAGHVFRFGNEAKTSVIFNHSHLWQDPEGKVAYDIPYAVGVWVDVLMFKSRFLIPAYKDSVKTEVVAALRQRIQRVEATVQQKTPFVAMTWKGKTSDRLYIRNGAFENFELTPKIATALGCEGGAATEVVINSVRFSEILTESDTSLNVRMETTQNFNCGVEARRGRTKILFRTSQPDKDGIYRVQEDSFKIFAEGE